MKLLIASNMNLSSECPHWRTGSYFEQSLESLSDFIKMANALSATPIFIGKTFGSLSTSDAIMLTCKLFEFAQTPIVESCRNKTMSVLASCGAIILADDVGFVMDGIHIYSGSVNVIPDEDVKQSICINGSGADLNLNSASDTPCFTLKKQHAGEIMLPDSIRIIDDADAHPWYSLIDALTLSIESVKVGVDHVEFVNSKQFCATINEDKKDSVFASKLRAIIVDDSESSLTLQSVIHQAMEEVATSEATAKYLNRLMA